MSDNGEIEVENPTGINILPKDVAEEQGSVKLFNKWSYEEVEVRDISLTDYIQIRSPVYISHSAGRYAVKRFRKAQCPIIERLTNSLMMNGRNNGKKLMAVRIVAHAFEIVRLPTTVRDFKSQKAGMEEKMVLTSADPHHDRPEPHPGRRRRHCQLRSP
ncbi:ribosomal protein S5 [Exserohilum turcicum]